MDLARQQIYQMGEFRSQFSRSQTVLKKFNELQGHYETLQGHYRHSYYTRRLSRKTQGSGMYRASFPIVIDRTSKVLIDGDGAYLSAYPAFAEVGEIQSESLKLTWWRRLGPDLVYFDSAYDLFSHNTSMIDAGVSCK